MGMWLLRVAMFLVVTGLAAVLAYKLLGLLAPPFGVVAAAVLAVACGLYLASRVGRRN